MPLKRTAENALAQTYGLKNYEKQKTSCNGANNDSRNDQRKRGNNMKQIQKLEYMTLTVFAVSVFSIGRPDIYEFTDYIGASPYPDAFVKNFSAIWFIILPLLAYMCLMYVKSEEEKAKPVLWLVAAILVIDIVLAFNFIPSTNMIQPGIWRIIHGFIINCITVYAVAFSYCCSTQRFGLTRFFYPLNYDRKKVRMTTSDPKAYKIHYDISAALCGMAAILMILKEPIITKFYCDGLLGPILLLFGVLKAGNLELIEKE